MKQLLEEFKKFIRRGNVLDMAVGVAVAGAFTAVVSAFTKAFISPLLALLTDGADLSDIKLVIRPEEVNADGEVVRQEVSLLFGTFLQAVMDFFIIALVLFAFLKLATFLNKRAEKLAEDMKENIDNFEPLRAMKSRLKIDLNSEDAEEETEANAPEKEAKPEESEEVKLLREIRDALVKNEEKDRK